MYSVANHVAASVQKPAKQGSGSLGVYISNERVAKHLTTSRELRIMQILFVCYSKKYLHDERVGLQFVPVWILLFCSG